MIPLFAAAVAGGGLYLLLMRKESVQSNQVAARAAVIDAPAVPAPFAPAPPVQARQELAVPESFSRSPTRSSTQFDEPLALPPSRQFSGPARDDFTDPGSGLAVDGRPEGVSQDDPTLGNRASNLLDSILDPFGGD